MLSSFHNSVLICVLPDLEAHSAAGKNCGVEKVHGAESPRTEPWLVRSPSQPKQPGQDAGDIWQLTGELETEE